MNYWKTLSILLFLPFFIACSGASEEGEGNDSDDEEEEIEELSEFRELLIDKFEEDKLPYDCDRTFDNYEPDEYLDEEEFNKLELFYIFPEYETKRYSAEERIELETGITLVVVTSKDNSMELSTYLITYNEDDWYVSNLRIGYEHTLIDMIISSKIDGEQVTRKIVEEYDGEVIVEEETYFIQGDGDIVWEEDLVGDEL